jgi:arylsulfatase A-like enzyme
MPTDRWLLACALFFSVVTAWQQLIPNHAQLATTANLEAAPSPSLGRSEHQHHNQQQPQRHTHEQAPHNLPRALAATTTTERWRPRRNQSQDELQSLLLAEVERLAQSTAGASASSRETLLKQFTLAFHDEEYLQHQFLMGTEKTSPFRLLNQHLFTHLKAHAFSAAAIAHVDHQMAALGLTGDDHFTAAAETDMNHCHRAARSWDRAAFLLNHTRLKTAAARATHGHLNGGGGGGLDDAATVCSSHAGSRNPPPNVIFIIADDLGWSDIGLHDADVYSPFIDKLHTEGVTLHNYYVDLVCSPSRASFMTGRYPMTTGAVDWFQRSDMVGLALGETTLGDMFREAGYATTYVGKWHLGYYAPEATPTFRGFDSFYGMYGGGADYYRHVASQHYDQRRDFARRCGPGCSVVDYASDGMYSSHLFGEEAVRLIAGHNESAAPLFMVVSFQAVHGPAHASPFNYADTCPAVAKHRTRTNSPPERAMSSDKEEGDAALERRRATKTAERAQRKKFTGVVTVMDNAIENITAVLAAKGMLHNTLLVFTTDNGAATVNTDAWGSSNYPLRGGKHTIWEGGTRGVGAVWGHPVTSHDEFKPFVSERMMHGVDWFPTLRHLLNLWQCPASQRTQQLRLDGISQLKAALASPFLPPSNSGGSGGSRSGGGGAVRTGFVYGNVRDSCNKMPVGGPLGAATDRTSHSEDVGCGFGLRDGDWKIVFGYGGYNDAWPTSPSETVVLMPYTSKATLCPDGYCLFNIAQDPTESYEVRLRWETHAYTRRWRMCACCLLGRRLVVVDWCGDCQSQAGGHPPTLLFGCCFRCCRSR